MCCSEDVEEMSHSSVRFLPLIRVQVIGSPDLLLVQFLLEDHKEATWDI